MHTTNKEVDIDIVLADKIMVLKRSFYNTWNTEAMTIVMNPNLSRERPLRILGLDVIYDERISQAVMWISRESKEACIKKLSQIVGGINRT